MNRVRTAALALVALGVVVTGCTTLPTTGPVHRIKTATGSDSDPNSTFVPPGPGPGDTPLRIARGFLTAMQANPLSTSVARSFLTTASKTSWQPNRATIIYDFPTLTQKGNTITARLADSHRLDERGGWVGGTPGEASLLNLQLVDEDGEWRISNPDNALVVPASYFQSRFVPFNLYFYDQTGQVVVPDQVYLPRGEQNATNLVNGLLAGPGPGLQGVVTSAFPLRTDLDQPVGVYKGVAEVPLTEEVRRLPPEQLHRAFVQLAWTLGQVPGITAVRITVDRTPVPLPDGRSQVPVSEGREYDPELLGGTNALLAIRSGRIWAYSGDLVKPAGGPLGRIGFSLRSLAQNTSGTRVAAISGNGRTVYAAPLSGATDPSRVRVIATGTDLLRPGYDMFGDLWLVDRTASGAKVRVVTHGTSRTVDVPGLTGKDVKAFSVTADGTRLAAVLASKASPTIVVTKLVRNDLGVLRRATPAQQVPVLTPDLGAATDIGWQSGTVLTVLTRASRISSRVAYIPVDGSPGTGAPSTTEVFDGVGTALVVPPTEQERLYLLDDKQRLYALGASGGWSRSPLTGIRGASYG